MESVQHRNPTLILDAEVMEAYLATVIGAAGERNFEMQVVGKHCLFNPLGGSGGIIAGIGADPVPSFKLSKETAPGGYQHYFQGATLQRPDHCHRCRQENLHRHSTGDAG